MRGLGLVGDSASDTLGDTNHVAVYRIPYHATELRDGGYPTESGSSIDIAGSLELDMAWHWRQQAMMQILGFAWRDIRTSGGSGPGIRRYLPEYQPDYTVVAFGGSTLTPFLTATKATIKPVGPLGFTSLNMSGVVGESASSSGSSGGSGDAYGGASKDGCNFRLARFLVTYDFLPYDVLPDPTATTTLYTVGSDGNTSTETLWTEYYNSNLRWVSFEMKPAAEYLSVPPTNSKDPNAATLKWSDNKISTRIGNPFPGNVGHIIGNIDYKFTWHQVPYEALPVDHIQKTIGRVNLRSVGLPGGQTIKAKPGQLLLLAVDTHRVGSPYGNRLWNVEYTMRYNPRGHNNFYDYVAGDWFQASKDGKYYPYNEGSGAVFPPVHATSASPGNPPPGKLLYDSVDYNYLFTPE